MLQMNGRDLYEDWLKRGARSFYAKTRLAVLLLIFSSRRPFRLMACLFTYHVGCLLVARSQGTLRAPSHFTCFGYLHIASAHPTATSTSLLSQLITVLAQDILRNCMQDGEQLAKYLETLNFDGYTKRSESSAASASQARHWPDDICGGCGAKKRYDGEELDNCGQVQEPSVLLSWLSKERLARTQAGLQGPWRCG